MKYIIFLCILLLVSACGGGGGGSSGGSSSVSGDVLNPGLSGINISPINFHFAGGSVTVDATVTDNVAVQSVVVDVSGAGTQQVAMSLVSGDDYSGTVVLPANENLFESDDVYTFRITATDTSNNQIYSSNFTITVASMKRPPNPPSF